VRAHGGFFLPAVPWPDVRPGLVFVGAVLIVLAGSLFYGILTQPSGSGRQSTHLLRFQIPSGENATAFAWGLNGSQVAFAVSWHASAQVSGVLSEPSGCRGTPTSCATGSVLVRWGPNGSGAWAIPDAGTFPMLLKFTNSGPAPASVAVSVVASTAPPTVLAPWVSASALISSATLGAVGALALFLGLFLRGGVFRPGGGPVPTRPRDPPG
jgi:hypothetical protein